MMVIAKVEGLAMFQGQWFTGSYWDCFMCKPRLYHTAKEHELVLSAEPREEIAR